MSTLPPSATRRNMEDAPKDGTPILAFAPTYYQGVGAWIVALWMTGDISPEGWYDNRAWRVPTLTCWMPLPEKP